MKQAIKQKKAKFSSEPKISPLSFVNTATRKIVDEIDPFSFVSIDRMIWRTRKGLARTTTTTTATSKAATMATTAIAKTATTKQANMIDTNEHVSLSYVSLKLRKMCTYEGQIQIHANIYKENL